jgi:hypothetical protein
MDAVAVSNPSLHDVPSEIEFRQAAGPPSGIRPPVSPIKGNGRAGWPWIPRRDEIHWQGMT